MCRDRGFRPADFLPQPVPRSLQPSFAHPIRIHHNSIFSGHSGYSGVGANVQMLNQLPHVTKFFFPAVGRQAGYLLYPFQIHEDFRPRISQAVSCRQDCVICVRMMSKWGGK